MKDDVYAKIRHDLRTPLNQIIGYSEMLEEEAHEKGQTTFLPDLKRIHTAARRLVSLIDSFFGPPKPGDADSEAVAPQQADEAAENLPSSSLADRLSGELASILVVDDNETNRDMLSRRLRKIGYKVEVAEHGEQALRMIEAQKYDLVLLDIMMPGISGLDVLKSLRQSYSLGDLPVIMATAMSTSSDIVDALKLGANDYVTKPLDFPVVLARLEGQLSLKRAKDQVRKLAEDLELRNRFIRHLFGRYLSQEVVSSLLESPEGLKLGGESRKVTILMSDIRGFAGLSHRLGPAQVVRLLNIYLGSMANIIMQHRGTIDEFIGDAILAIFGAPLLRDDDARRAVACAIEMQQAMNDVNRQNEAEGLPAIEMGIGIHTGEAVAGNIGSANRAKYGVVGPVVNLTGRIESCTLAGQILISEATLKEVEEIAQLGGQLAVNVKGFKDPITLYEVCGIAGDYNLSLEQNKVSLVRLAKEISIRVAVLEEKRISGSVFQGKIVKLSSREAEIRSENRVPPLCNLKIDLDADDGSPVPGEIYAKVLLSPEEGSDTFLAHFTSLSPDAEAFFRAALKNPF